MDYMEELQKAKQDKAVLEAELKSAKDKIENLKASLTERGVTDFSIEGLTKLKSDLEQKINNLKSQLQNLEVSTNV